MFRCRRCDYSQGNEFDQCPACGAGWKEVDVSHGPGCPKNLLQDALDTGRGALVRRYYRLLNAKSLGFTITLEDVTEEEFRTMEMIDAEKGEVTREEDGGAKSFQELLMRKLSRR